MLEQDCPQDIGTPNRILNVNLRAAVSKFGQNSDVCVKIRNPYSNICREFRPCYFDHSYLLNDKHNGHKMGSSQFVLPSRLKLEGVRDWSASTEYIRIHQVFAILAHFDTGTLMNYTEYIRITIFIFFYYHLQKKFVTWQKYQWLDIVVHYSFIRSLVDFGGN